MKLFNEFTQKQREFLCQPVRDINASVRLRNILFNTDHIHLASAVSFSADEFLKLPNAGRKTMREFEELLSQHGLTMATAIPDWTSDLATTINKEVAVNLPTPVPLPLFNAYTPEQKGLLCATIDELNLPTRLNNNLKRERCVYLGDALRFAERDLLRQPNMGRRSLAQFKEILAAVGLEIGKAPVDWSADAAKNYRFQNSTPLMLLSARDQAQYAGPLEKQFLSYLSQFANERNAQIGAFFWGWDATGRKTLDKTGQEFGITRERARQITTKLKTKIQKTRATLPACEQLIAHIQANLPMTETDFLSEIQKSGYTNKIINSDSLLSYCELRNLPPPWSTFKIKGERFLSRDKLDDDLFDNLYSNIHRRATRKGCGGVEWLETYLLEKTVTHRLQQFVFSEVVNSPSFFWLDPLKRNFFSFRDINLARCRAVNRLQKALSVASEVPLSQLRTAVNRASRMEGMHVGKAELAALCQGYDLATFQDDQILTKSGALQSSQHLSKTEELILDGFRNLAQPVHTNDLLSFCAAKGINETTFYIHLQNSPIVVRLLPGIYQLIGHRT